MDHVLNHAKQTTGEAERLSPLEAFVAWLTTFLRTIAGLKRRTVFPPNWKDHWQGLRELEWYRDQILAFSAQHVLAGGSLDDRTDFQLILEVPESYGVCPRTPQAMNRRFIAMAQFRLDPDKYIQRHIHRIARAAGTTLAASLGGCPLRHATQPSRAISPAFAGGSLAFCARGPPPCSRLPIPHCLAGHTGEVAPARPRPKPSRIGPAAGQNPRSAPRPFRQLPLSFSAIPQQIHG